MTDATGTAEVKIFKPWWVCAAEARERLRQPIVFEGKTYYCLTDAARCCGYSNSRLRNFVAKVRGEDCVLTGRHGIRFVRKPRHKGDMAAPLYFDLDTLPVRGPR